MHGPTKKARQWHCQLVAGCLTISLQQLAHGGARLQVVHVQAAVADHAHHGAQLGLLHQLPRALQELEEPGVELQE
jgi:hypothetical protein